MMSAPTSPSTTPVLDPREQLRLKPKAPTTGWADGGWWPRSRNLAAAHPARRGTRGVRADRARGVLMAAGRRGNTDDIDTLLQCRPIATEVLGRSAQP